MKRTQHQQQKSRVQTVLVDTVTLLCQNGLSYEHQLCIQGVIGITVDERDTFIVHMNKTFSGVSSEPLDGNDEDAEGSAIECKEERERLGELRKHSTISRLTVGGGRFGGGLYEYPLGLRKRDRPTTDSSNAIHRPIKIARRSPPTTTQISSATNDVTTTYRANHSASASDTSVDCSKSLSLETNWCRKDRGTKRSASVGGSIIDGAVSVDESPAISSDEEERRGKSIAGENGSGETKNQENAEEKEERETKRSLSKPDQVVEQNTFCQKIPDDIAESLVPVTAADDLAGDNMIRVKREIDSDAWSESESCGARLMSTGYMDENDGQKASYRRSASLAFQAELKLLKCMKPEGSQDADAINDSRDDDDDDGGYGYLEDENEDVQFVRKSRTGWEDYAGAGDEGSEYFTDRSTARHDVNRGRVSEPSGPSGAGLSQLSPRSVPPYYATSTSFPHATTSVSPQIRLRPGRPLPCFATPPVSMLGMAASDGGLGYELQQRFVCSVPGCGTSFSNKQNLQRHQTNKHGRAKCYRNRMMMFGGGGAGGSIGHGSLGVGIDGGAGMKNEDGYSNDCTYVDSN